jgi:hypothetical protein
VPLAATLFQQMTQDHQATRAPGRAAICAPPLYVALVILYQKYTGARVLTPPPGATGDGRGWRAVAERLDDSRDTEPAAALDPLPHPGGFRAACAGDGLRHAVVERAGARQRSARQRRGKGKEVTQH